MQTYRVPDSTYRGLFPARRAYPSAQKGSMHVSNPSTQEEDHTWALFETLSVSPSDLMPQCKKEEAANGRTKSREDTVVRELAEQQEKKQLQLSSRRSRCRGKKEGVVVVDQKKRRRYIRFSKSFAPKSLIHCWKSHGGDVADPQVPDICTSLEDSFISIKFEGNGVASWDKDKASSLPPQNPKDLQSNKPKEAATGDKSVDVHNPNPRASFRWRKRMMNQLLRLIRWRRSNKKKTNVKRHEVKRTRWNWRRSWFKRRKTIKR
ncbi:hypothetical protein Droror1_Dr00011434 [Drosera rotundifolia]